MGNNTTVQIWGTLCAIVLILLSTILPARAQNSTGALNLTTSPLPVSLKAKPGETVSTELRVRNSGNQTETLKVGLMKFSAYGEEGKPKLEDRAPGDNYFDWVSFSETKFVAEPDQQHNIKMTISLPKEAALGYYYAVTFTRADAPETKDGTNKLQGGTAILVLLEALVSNADRNVQITSFQSDKKIYEFLPVKFAITVENKGNIHVAPRGNIFIKRSGNLVATIEVNQQNGNILPESKRVFTAEWNDGFPHYEPEQKDGKVVLKNSEQFYELKWNMADVEKLRFGRYTAFITMSYDDGTRDVPVEAMVTFWVIPWRLIFVLLIPVLITGLLAYGYLRLRRKLKLLEVNEESKKNPAKKKT